MAATLGSKAIPLKTVPILTNAKMIRKMIAIPSEHQIAFVSILKDHIHVFVQMGTKSIVRVENVKTSMNVIQGRA